MFCAVLGLLKFCTFGFMLIWTLIDVLLIALQVNHDIVLCSIVQISILMFRLFLKKIVQHLHIYLSVWEFQSKKVPGTEGCRERKFLELPLPGAKILRSKKASYQVDSTCIKGCVTALDHFSLTTFFVDYNTWIPYLDMETVRGVAGWGSMDPDQDHSWHWRKSGEIFRQKGGG